MSRPAAPAPGGTPGRREAMAADLAARHSRARLVTRPHRLPFPGIAGEPGGPAGRPCAVQRRDSGRAGRRPGLVPAASSGRPAAAIIAGAAVPGGKLPAQGTGAGHHRAGGAEGSPLARQAGMPGPSPDPGRRQAPAPALARVLPEPAPGILPPACPRRSCSPARAAVPARQGQP